MVGFLKVTYLPSPTLKELNKHLQSFAEGTLLDGECGDKATEVTVPLCLRGRISCALAEPARLFIIVRGVLQTIGMDIIRALFPVRRTNRKLRC